MMDSLLKADPGAGQELQSMRERVAHLGGTLQITSATGKGAQIRVVIPLR